MPEIVERREVLVRDGDRELAFVAEPDAGRLTIVDRSDDDEVCAIHLGDREELTAFVEGLRRVLDPRDGSPEQASDLLDGRPARGRDAADGGSAGPPRPPPLGSRQRDTAADGGAGRGDDRDEQVRRARQRHPQAFSAWTPEEEQRLLDAHGGGAAVADLARDHGRSQRAIEMRLDKLGAS